MDEEKDVFSHARVEAGIHAVCAAMDELELTMLERMHVTRSVYHAAKQLIDDGMKVAFSKKEPDAIDATAELAN